MVHKHIKCVPFQQFLTQWHIHKYSQFVNFMPFKKSSKASMSKSFILRACCCMFIQLIENASEQWVKHFKNLTQWFQYQTLCQWVRFRKPILRRCVLTWAADVVALTVLSYAHIFETRDWRSSLSASFQHPLEPISRNLLSSCCVQNYESTVKFFNLDLMNPDLVNVSVSMNTDFISVRTGTCIFRCDFYEEFAIYERHWLIKWW